jgi:DNA repair photolyase
MYNWVTHTWSPIQGCSHQCDYCYVKTYRRLPEDPTIDDSFPVLGEGRTIFIGHMCDMFSARVPDKWIRRVLDHCKLYNNKYVFQTKNPERILSFIPDMPAKYTIGTTVETNRQELLDAISQAPSVSRRIFGISQITTEKFITIEPVIQFDTATFADMIISARPNFVNIGADSKNHNLPEPTRDRVNLLIVLLKTKGIEIRKKINLERLNNK